MEFKARKSFLKEVTLLRLILCIFIIPIIYLVYKALEAAYTTIEFYPDKIITKSGIISKKERKSSFFGVYSVGYSQSLKGRIFGYGDVDVDVSGRWDISTKGIKNPKALVDYLETRTIKKNNVTEVLQN